MFSIKKISYVIIIILVLLSSVFITQKITHAKDDETEKSQTQIDLEKKIKEYEDRLAKIRKDKNTLTSQIAYMNTQIYLTSLKIQSTKAKIKKTKKEIDLLKNRVQTLDSTIDVLSKLLLERVVESYKKKPTSLFMLILNTDKASSLMKDIKYMQVVQRNNQMLLIQVQKNKINLEEQQTLREEKQKMYLQLEQTLKQQQTSLTAQKEAKKNLLAITNNSEQRYQQLLTAAKKQLASFKSFTRAVGGGVISANGFGSGSNGWYYSQRDARWANFKIGNSNEILLNVGCLITDVAMVLKSKGLNWTPIDVAANSNYFFSNTAYLNRPITFPNGHYYHDVSTSQIKTYLSNNKPVIVGLYAGAYGTHFVVLKKIDGDDYIMNDPYYGPDKKFSDYYSKTSIFEAKVID